MFLPKPTQHGGSLVGNSYLSLYATCPKKWFYTFYYPQLIDKTQWHGLATKHTAEALLMGSMFHEGIAALYRSGCRDGEDTGEWVLDRAIDCAETHYLQRKAEYSDEAYAERDWTQTREMLTRYFETYGPGGRLQDWPDMKVVFDDSGEPYIEREFTVPLTAGYVYTCRVDLIAERLGFVQPVEHKTSVASFVSQRLKTIHRDSQFTGEVFVVKDAFPEHMRNGVLANVICKNPAQKRTARSPEVATRETTDRTDHQLETFKAKVIRTLAAIDTAIELYNSLGGGPEVASICFPEYGENNGACHSYNRECEYAVFCNDLQPEEISLRNFRPKTQEETITLKEYGG